ncbi:MAG: type II toxin-antitoxin system Phd/YefM family antitoxin [Nostoc sp.]
MLIRLVYIYVLFRSLVQKSNRSPIVEAAANLSDLVEAAINGEEVILLNGDRRAIKLMPVESVRPRPKFGSAKGLI